MFLGTAASEGYPDAFCDCANCQRARILGGESLRKRSSVLIDDELLIDLGPDLMAASQMHGRSLGCIRYCIQTHEHQDHLDPAHLISRSPSCGVMDAPRLHFYGSPGALARAAAGALGARLTPDGLADPAASERMNVTVHAIEPFQVFAVGPYVVSSVRATHDPTIAAMLHIITRDDRTLFYATDTGSFPEETWDALRAWGYRFNVVAMDHTFGWAARATGHQNAEQFREQVARMRDEGLLADDARIYATHIAHHSNPVHPELVARAAESGYLVAYDGLVVTV